MRKDVKLMPDEDMGQDSSSMSPFIVTESNLALLKGQDAAKCIATMGHGFIESYTEKASITGMWTLDFSDNPKVSEETFYAFRMMIQKYFFRPRGISEVCEFFSSSDIFSLVPTVKVSVFGYRDRSSKLPKDILDKSASVASSYLTPKVLSRNIERQSIRLRPWQGLSIKDLPDSSLIKNMAPVAPKEFFVLNVQKAEQLLLLLLLYSKDPKSGVDNSKLNTFGEILDKLLSPGLLEPNGAMLNENRDLLAKLVGDLEEALPAGDPDKDLK